MHVKLLKQWQAQSDQQTVTIFTFLIPELFFKKHKELRQLTFALNWQQLTMCQIS